MVFFEHQSDPDARYMAAFTAGDPDNREDFSRHWGSVLSNPKIAARTILYQDRIAGHVLSYEEDGRSEVSYWIGKPFWGQGIATQALKIFLETVNMDRPIFARAAKDNFASLRVLEKCGFILIEDADGYANARGCEIGEMLLELRNLPESTREIG
jgi:RimJ/RimL family protein N-acetyltransferase